LKKTESLGKEVEAFGLPSTQQGSQDHARLSALSRPTTTADLANNDLGAQGALTAIIARRTVPVPPPGLSDPRAIDDTASTSLVPPHGRLLPLGAAAADQSLDDAAGFYNLTRFTRDHQDRVIIAYVNNCTDLLTLINAQPIDAIIVSLDLPMAIPIIQLVKEQSPYTQVLALTAKQSNEEIFLALRAGAIGYLHTDAPSEKSMQCSRQWYTKKRS